MSDPKLRVPYLNQEVSDLSKLRDEYNGEMVTLQKALDIAIAEWDDDVAAEYTEVVTDIVKNLKQILNNFDVIISLLKKLDETASQHQTGLKNNIMTNLRY